MYEAEVRASSVREEDGAVRFSFPVNLTIIGSRSLRTGDAATGAELPPDRWCWTTRYATADVEQADALQAQADAAYNLRWEREFFDPYVADRRRAFDAAIAAWEAEFGDVPPDEVTEPRPVDTSLDPDAVALCAGEPGVVPDFSTAFDAAAEFVAALTPVVPTIRPMQPDGTARAITGNPAYLERLDADGQPVPLVQSRPTTTEQALGRDLSGLTRGGGIGAGTPIAGTVTLDAEGTYAVDWGDGTTTAGLTEPGVGLVASLDDPAAPTVTHVWTDTASREVTVTDTWDVTITIVFLGETYTFAFREDLVPWPALAVEVAEVRAVRD